MACKKKKMPYLYGGRFIRNPSFPLFMSFPKTLGNRAFGLCLTYGIAGMPEGLKS